MHTYIIFLYFLFDISGHGSLGISLIVVALGTCNQTLVVAAMITGFAIAGTGVVGFNVTPIDMAPQFAGKAQRKRTSKKR